MKTLQKLSFLLLFGLVLTVGCSKDNDDNDTPPEVVKLEIQSKLDEINIPDNMVNSQNLYALQVSIYVAQIKSIAGYFGFFDPIEGAEYNDGTYFWSYGGQSVWMTYSETGSAYVYEMDVDFGTGRVDYITSQQSKDGSSGWMKIFDYTNSTEEEYLFEYTWKINIDGSVIIKQMSESDDFMLEIKGSPDDSGYANYYENGVLTYEFVWNNDGSGYYKSYDDSGEETDSDSWTVDDL